MQASERLRRWTNFRWSMRAANIRFDGFGIEATRLRWTSFVGTRGDGVVGRKNWSSAGSTEVRWNSLRIKIQPQLWYLNIDSDTEQCSRGTCTSPPRKCFHSCTACRLRRKLQAILLGGIFHLPTNFNFSLFSKLLYLDFIWSTLHVLLASSLLLPVMLTASADKHNTISSPSTLGIQQAGSADETSWSEWSFFLVYQII